MGALHEAHDGLNGPQRQAVEHRHGPLLILAGAGAGKTRVITHRILELIRGGIAPANILAVTFTNKAAREMQERVRTLITRDPALNFPVSDLERPLIGTFHALGVFIIKENARALGLTRHFTIYDRSDSLRAVKQAIEDAGFDPKQFEPRSILAAISRQKGKGVGLEEYREEAKDFYPRLVSRVWERYAAALAKERALDFDDLLLKTVHLLRNHPDIAKRYGARWGYAHVDEYQDINGVQYELVRLLTPHHNLCVVGDIDQNIYSWRGADLEYILSFERDYPNATTIVLEENYRSTQNILAAANDIIRKNTRRREKNLFTKNAPGELLSVFVGIDEGDEARFVASRARELLEEGVRASEIAILYRANFQSRVLEEAFLALELPYQVLGVRFFERREVKDVLSYLRAALNQESAVDLKRAISFPSRGVGKVSLLKILSGKEETLTGSVRERVRSFRALLEKIRGLAASAAPSHVLRTIVVESGIEKALKEGGEEDMERLENVQELVTLATRYDSLPVPSGLERFLEESALQSDQDELRDDRDAVRLMTVHAAKGLEFSHVFIVGLEDGLFPHEGGGEEGRDSEEERRLFYVALTRARTKLFLCYASTRTIFGARRVNLPSEFLLDLPQELLAGEDADAPRRTIYLE